MPDTVAASGVACDHDARMEEVEPMIRVLIADDHGVIRDGLGRLIAALPDRAERHGLGLDGAA